MFCVGARGCESCTEDVSGVLVVEKNITQAVEMIQDILDCIQNCEDYKECDFSKKVIAHNYRTEKSVFWSEFDGKVLNLKFLGVQGALTGVALEYYFWYNETDGTTDIQDRS